MLDNCCAFTGHRPYKFPWRYNDSIMTLAVAGAIMSTEEKDHKLESAAVWYMQELGRRYFNCGYGGQFRQWLVALKPRPKFEVKYGIVGEKGN